MKRKINKIPLIGQVIRNPVLIKDIKNPAFDICMAALMQDGMTIKYIDISLFTRKEYFLMCEAAIKQNIKSIACVKREHFSSMLWNSLLSSAVRHNGLNLRWIKEQTPELCLEAINQNHRALAHVDKAMCDSINSHCYALLEKAALEKAAQDKKSKKAETKEKTQPKDKKPKIDLRNTTRQTEALCLKAVQQDGLQIQYVWKQTRKLVRAAMKQDPRAAGYVRDGSLIWFDDLFSDLVFNLGKMANGITDLAFYYTNKDAKKIPKTLKTNKNQFKPEQYYFNCKEALDNNSCNIKFINPAFLSFEQYKELCLIALNKIPKVMTLINNVKTKKDFYFRICYAMLAEIKDSQNKEIFNFIDSRLMSTGQYYRLVEKYLKLCNKKLLINILESIDVEKLTNKQYYMICQKLLRLSNLIFNEIQPLLLTKTQYFKLCLFTINKNHALIDSINKKHLIYKDWLELCKIVIKKNAGFIYFLDISSKKEFEELLSLSLSNGGGLKYISKQNYRQCLKIIKKNSYELKYVLPKQFTAEQYYNLCKMSIKLVANSLGEVNDEFLSNEMYQELCAIAIESFPGTIRFIDQDRIPVNLYRSWYLKAADYRPHFIENVPYSRQYYNLCMKAVKKNGNVLNYIKYLRLPPKEYDAVCRAAVKQTKEADRFIRYRSEDLFKDKQ